ncbi:MAG TPA: tetratricopeptide repeat protein [Nitrospirota bacterium]|nr:tetratricopeptide repeat protein [Nitrospirota bacterium]
MKRKKKQQSQTIQPDDLCSSKSSESSDVSKAIRQHVPCNIAVAVSLLSLVVYLPALRIDFVNYDDHFYILDNLHIRSLDWTFFKWAFSDLSSSFWHPLTWISYAVDYALWGMNPMGFHLTAILLHAINTFLVVYLAVRLLEAANIPPNSKGTLELSQLSFPQTKPAVNPSGNNEGFQTSRSDRAKIKRKLANNRFNSVSLHKGKIEHWLPHFLDARGVLITAGVTGLLFGLHPLHVESVAWVSERKDLLCALFFLLSIIAYTSFIASLGKKGDQDKNSSIYTSLTKGKWYLLSLTLFVFALSSKTMAVSLPATLLILDWYPYRRLQSIRNFIFLVIEKIPFIVFSLLISIVSISAQKTTGNITPLVALPLSTRVLVAAKALVVYLWNMVLPLNLIPFYPYPKNVKLLSIEYLFALSLVTGITALCIFQARRYQAWLSLWGYYVLTLLPVLGIVQIGSFSRADRFTYLPSLGPFLLLGLVAAWVSTKIRRAKKPVLTSKLVMIAAVIFLFVPLVYLTLSQIRIWKNSLTLWTYAIEKEPDKAAVAFKNRGLYFHERGQFDRAIEDYSKAIDLDPLFVGAYNNRGLDFVRTGQLSEAFLDFNKAVTLNPDYYAAYVNRGLAFDKAGQLERAIVDYDKAIALNPSDYNSYNYRGIAFDKMGNFDKAIADYDTAIAINPFFIEAYQNRGAAFHKLGQFDKAIGDYDKVIALKPTDYNVYITTGVSYGSLSLFDKAIECFNTAIAINPNDQEAYYNRGFAYSLVKQYDRALQDLNKTLELNQNNVMAYNNRGKLYLNTGNREMAILDFQKACNLKDELSCNALRNLRSGIRNQVR